MKYGHKGPWWYVVECRFFKLCVYKSDLKQSFIFWRWK